MKNFHIILQRTIVTFFVLCFVIVSTYIPQSWNDVKSAQAGSIGGSTEITQILNNVQLKSGNISAAATASFSGITSGATANNWVKEYLLDGLGWMLAKQIISQMTASIVSWINSGFEGSPAFVQDLKGFLLKAGDEAFGKYLEELGGPLSSLCSPFKLDISIAISNSYLIDREVKKPTCTLSGALTNLENFTEGTFDQGGWEAWFEVTSNPTRYTGLGSLLEAEMDASIRIVTAKNEETKLLDFGGGFMSKKVCTGVAGSAQEKCSITTPGAVISEALNFQLSTGQRSLIEADEINEIIGALISQVSQKAISGLAGMGSNSSGPGAYVNQLSADGTGQAVSPTSLRDEINDSLATEIKYRDLTILHQGILTAYAGNVLNNVAQRNNVQAELGKMTTLLADIKSNITSLNSILARYNALPLPQNETSATSVTRNQLSQEYSRLRLHTPGEVSIAETSWKAMVK